MTAARPPIVKLEPTGKTSNLASPSQRIAFHYNQLNPTNRLLLLRPRLLLEGPINIQALHDTIEELVARHAVLGSRLVEEGGVLVNYHATERHRIPFEVISFEDTPAEQHPARWDQLFETLARPFDLSTGPMLRSALVKLGPDRHVLTFVIHHAVIDRGSMQPFIAELKAGYRAMTEGTPWPKPALQNIDLSAYIEAFCASPAGLKQRAYWDKTLADAKPLELPIDHPRDAIEAERDAHPRGMALRSMKELSSVIENPVHARLAALARAERTSNFVVILGALATVLVRARQQTDITFTSPISGRSKPALANMIGYIGNSVAMRIDMTGNPTFKELLGRVRNTVLMSWGNADVPLDNIPHGIRRLNVNYSPGVEGGSTTSELAPGVSISQVRDAASELDKVQLPSDIQLWIYDAADRCRLRLAYLSELFEQSTIKGILDSLIATLDEMCTSPDKKLAAS
jgi:hypothetical protein